MEFEDKSRRTFLKEAALYGGSAMLANQFGSLAFAAGQGTVAPNWKNQIGLELFTVRGVMTTPAEYEATLAAIAKIGYKEIEPAGGYNNMDAKTFRAMIDRYGLSMPSTHSGASGATQLELEKRLEEFAIMGLKYTGASIQAAGARAGGGGAAAAPAAGRGGAAAAPAARGGAATLPAQVPGRGGAAPAGGARGGGAAGQGAAPAGPAPPQPPATVDSVKQRAERTNAMGKIVAKFGMKILIHNHSQEFELLSDGKTSTYDILCAETDPATVAMQMDVGWASVAGQDPIAWFKRFPGRFELWHVKDAINIKNRPAGLAQGARPPGMMLMPVGLGEVDYKTIFANAQLAGLKHFVVEQDNAASWGDAVAACRVSYTNLATKILV